ncbi:nucleotide exchange factor GrpE, partial [Herbaspirillum sp. B65]|uniref:nucleotide exchange factor GrpE n=1 Tax=Herbaspirillum sp. B65 TaxID=137708 RepID=UPI0005C81397
MQDIEKQEAQSVQQEPQAADTAAAATGAANAAEQAAAAAPAEPTLEEKLAAAEAKAAEMQDAFLRARAEGENIRRRAQEDIAKAHKFAIEGFAESLLAVKDSLK